jgi:hypothetical protein
VSRIWTSISRWLPDDVSTALESHVDCFAAFVLRRVTMLRLLGPRSCCTADTFILTAKHFCRRQNGHQLRRALSMMQLPAPPELRQENRKLQRRTRRKPTQLTDARVQRASADAPLEETRAAVAAGRAVVLAAGSVAAHAARHTRLSPPSSCRARNTRNQSRAGQGGLFAHLSCPCRVSEDFSLLAAHRTRRLFIAQKQSCGSSKESSSHPRRRLSGARPRPAFVCADTRLSPEINVGAERSVNINIAALFRVASSSPAWQSADGKDLARLHY